MAGAARARVAVCVTIVLFAGALAFALAGPLDAETGSGANPVARAAAGSITAGYQHTCAIRADGTVICWGTPGQLGLATFDMIGDDEPPATLAALPLGAGRTATDIGAGSSHTCAVLDDGNVRGWGGAFQGQLGYGDTKGVGG